MLGRLADASRSGGVADGSACAVPARRVAMRVRPVRAIMESRPQSANHGYPAITVTPASTTTQSLVPRRRIGTPQWTQTLT